MLDVEGREDVDAGVEQLLDVLPALRVARALGVRVGQLVDEEQARPPGEGGVEVELLEGDAAVGDGPARQDRKPLEEGGGLRPAVGLDDAHEHVAARRQLFARGLQHRVGLPHAGSGAEEERQLAALGPALLLGDAPQQLVGVRA